MGADRFVEGGTETSRLMHKDVTKMENGRVRDMEDREVLGVCGSLNLLYRVDENVTWYNHRGKLAVSTGAEHTHTTDSELHSCVFAEVAPVFTETSSTMCAHGGGTGAIAG